MSNFPSTLMPWVQLLQALLVPVVAVIGTWIALSQMRIARVKLQHDLYDRRYAIFQAMRSFLSHVIREGNVFDEELIKLIVGTADYKFILDRPLEIYVENFIENARTLHATASYLRSEMTQEERAATARKKGEQLRWLIDQIDSLSENFRPLLTLEVGQ